MNPNVKNHEWQVYGLCIDKKFPKVCNKPITIPEQLSNLAMKPHPPSKTDLPKSIPPPDPFGMPIEAGLAVNLIKAAYDSLKPLFEGYLDSFHGNDKEKATKTMIDLQNIAYGVAFNKTLLLKILSQPNCEGIRSYLCAREGGDGLHYSLVMVGIDANGYDLNYYPATNPAPPGYEFSKDITLANSITTYSLVGEYGNPPGTGGIVQNGKELYIDEHYYLLKQAIGKDI